MPFAAAAKSAEIPDQVFAPFAIACSALAGPPMEEKYPEQNAQLPQPALLNDGKGAARTPAGFGASERSTATVADHARGGQNSTVVGMLASCLYLACSLASYHQLPLHKMRCPSVAARNASAERHPPIPLLAPLHQTAAYRTARICTTGSLNGDFTYAIDSHVRQCKSPCCARKVPPGLALQPDRVVVLPPFLLTVLLKSRTSLTALLQTYEYNCSKLDLTSATSESSACFVSNAAVLGPGTNSNIIRTAPVWTRKRTDPLHPKFASFAVNVISVLWMLLPFFPMNADWHCGGIATSQKLLTLAETSVACKAGITREHASRVKLVKSTKEAGLAMSSIFSRPNAPSMSTTSLAAYLPST
eukprot:CAMPEP_0172703722 /NCGR_PEP_ID=MMETSP1074-20121228/38597_1 /TAXON_ID=2916 /ORGANISM="Ceratium fusus, Strain PA161109" /LENGTH=358 /DNA_ID=CAMNT_0013525699 /DNA_START=124 /DNA_END=1203 /DNA_ORIENTATION=-